MLTYEIYNLMVGNIGPIADFDVNIVNIQNIFYMMGNRQLKIIVMLNEWAASR